MLALSGRSCSPSPSQVQCHLRGHFLGGAPYIKQRPLSPAPPGSIFIAPHTPNPVLLTGDLAPQTVFSRLAGFPEPERRPAFLGHVHVCRTRSRLPAYGALQPGPEKISNGSPSFLDMKDPVPGKALQSLEEAIAPARRQAPRAERCLSPGLCAQARLCQSQPRPPGAGWPCAPPAGRDVTSCPAQYGSLRPPVA